MIMVKRCTVNNHHLLRLVDVDGQDTRDAILREHERTLSSIPFVDSSAEMRETGIDAKRDGVPSGATASKIFDRTLEEPRGCESPLDFKGRKH